MYLVINKWVIAVKVSNFSGQYLRNHWTFDIGVLGYIGIVWPKEHSPNVRSFPPGTPYIYMMQVISLSQMGMRMRITSHRKLQVIRLVTAMRKIHARWRNNWKMMCSNKSCLPWMLDKHGAVRDVEAQQEEIEAEAQEELSSWGILLTRSMLAKIMRCATVVSFRVCYTEEGFYIFI